MRHPISNAPLRLLLMLFSMVLLGQRSSPALAQCDIAGRWRMHTQNVGDSIWTLTRQGNGGYDAREEGLGAATGQALMNANAMHMEWRTRAGWSGVVDLVFDPNCTRAQGRQGFFKGRTGSEMSWWTRLPAGAQAFAHPQLNGPRSLVPQLGRPLG